MSRGTKMKFIDKVKDILQLHSWSKKKKVVVATLSLFMASLTLSVIYYMILSGFLYFGEDLRLKKENRELAELNHKIEKELSLLENATNSLSYRDRRIYKSIFNTYPIDDVPMADCIQVIYREKSEAEFGRDIDLVASKARIVREFIDSTLSHLNYLQSSANNIPSKIPIENLALTQIGASQGRKMNPFYKSITPHNGLDIIALTNTKVYAPADGVIEKVVAKESRSGGKSITINHLNGYKTRYANLHNIAVREGQKIKSGQNIGSVGSTGMSLAPHLHYEVIFNGRYMNPVNYFFADLAPKEFYQLIVMSENMGQSLD